MNVPDEDFLVCRRKLLMFFGARRCGDRAEDLASEVLVRVLRRIELGDSIDNVGAFSIAVARNVWLEELRTLDKDRRSEPIDPNRASVQPGVVPQAELQDACLQQSLAQLSKEEQILVRRFYWEGLTSVDLAAGLGTSANAVIIRIFRIRQKLKKFVEACMEGKEIHV